MPPFDTSPLIVKSAERGRSELKRTIYRIDIGNLDIPGPGTKVGGGGTVVRAAGSSVTVEFQNPGPEGPIRVRGVRTTVIQEYSFPHEDGLGIGVHVSGGGVVVNVEPATVTIQFPNGVPDHVDLPGIETTVIEESSGTTDRTVVASPWQPDDVLIPAGGFPIQNVELAIDSAHRSFRLPTPGSKENSVRMDNFLLNPTNTSSCSCAVFLGSFTSAGVKVGQEVMILPGKSIPFYQLEEGASFVLATCSKGCTETGCVCELTVASGVA